MPVSVGGVDAAPTAWTDTAEYEEAGRVIQKLGILVDVADDFTTRITGLRWATVMLHSILRRSCAIVIRLRSALEQAKAALRFGFQRKRN